MKIILLASLLTFSALGDTKPEQWYRVYASAFDLFKREFKYYELEHGKLPQTLDEFYNYINPEALSGTERQIRATLVDQSGFTSIKNLAVMPIQDLEIRDRNGTGPAVLLGSEAFQTADGIVRRWVLFKNGTNATDLVSIDVPERLIQAGYSNAAATLPELPTYPSAMQPPSRTFQAMMERPFNPPPWITNTESATGSTSVAPVDTSLTKSALPAETSASQATPFQFPAKNPRWVMLGIGVIFLAVIAGAWFSKRR